MSNDTMTIEPMTTGNRVPLIVADYKAMIPTSEIGRRYGVPQPAVSQIVRAAGVPLRNPAHTRVSDEDRETVVRLLRLGRTHSEIAESVGISRSTVGTIAQEVGITREKRRERVKEIALQVVAEIQRKEGLPPTMSQLAETVPGSYAYVRGLVDEMVEEGHLRVVERGNTLLVQAT